MPSSGLNAKQLRFLAALLARPTVKAAATAAGVSYATAKRWTALPAFAEAYRAARQRSFGHAQAMLQAAAARAVRRLVREMEGDRAADRIRAAKAVLDAATEAAELTDVLERLAALEAAGANGEDDGRHGRPRAGPPPGRPGTCTD
jgi:hypothetical protein